MSKKFLGRGWKFPVNVNPNTGKIGISSYEEDIGEAIKIILMTTPGERVFRPDFGCNIREYIFEVMDTNTITLIKQEIRQALIRWEPRIKDVEIEIKNTDGSRESIDIGISYVVRTTNNMYNKVFPFYLNEGVEG